MALPTHADFLATLPRVSRPEDEKCDICAEAFNTSPTSSHDGDHPGQGSHAAVTTPCSHVFGEVCLLEWLKDQTTCPMCRRVLYQAEHVEHDGWATGDEGSISDDATSEVAFTEEDIQLRQELRELKVNVSGEDGWNGQRLVRFFDALAAARAAQDLERVQLMKRRIWALNHARLLCWRDDDLVVEQSDFRNFAAGIVYKGTLTPGIENKDFAVDAEAIRERLLWFFRRALEAAVYDLGGVYDDGPGRERVGLALHPAMLQLVDAAIVMLRGADGALYSPEQMKRELWDWLDAQLWDSAPWGFEFVIWDLTEVAAVALCGLPVKMYVKRGLKLEGRGWEGWEVFRDEQPAV